MAAVCDIVVSPGILSESDEMIASSSTTNDHVDYMELSSTSVGDGDGLLKYSRRKIKTKDDKSCGVCGDKALGYNFNAITCESCKAFFRRNASKDKSMVCLFENNCVVNIRTRRFCPSCRIKKCYKIGMNKDMILDDGEKKKRMTKVVTNRTKKDYSIITETALVQAKPETKLETDLSVSVTNTSNDLESVEDIEKLSTTHGKDYYRTSDVIFRHIPKLLLPSDSRMYYKLTCDESTLLAKVTQAYQETLAAMPEIGPYSEPKQYQKASDLVNHSEVCVRKLIMFVKHLDDFRRLSQEDQIAALKACVMNTLLLRSALFYSIEKDAWLTPKGEIPTSILKNTTGFVSLHNNHVYYCRRVKSMAQNDYHIYALLQALIIFDPAGTHIHDREFVSSLQDRYILLLKHYFESCFSFDFAKEYYVSAMDRLCDLKFLSEEHAKVLLQVNPIDVEPLMLEVLNLK